MGRSKKTDRCQIEVSSIATQSLKRLDARNRKYIYEKIGWIAKHHDQIEHHPLLHLPSHLKGLKKRREGDYRILYWYSPEVSLITIYDIIHRSSEYKFI